MAASGGLGLAPSSLTVFCCPPGPAVTGTEAVAGSSLAEIDDQRWGRALDPVFVVEHDAPSPGDPVVVAAAAKVSRVDWMVRAENGSEFSGSSVVAEMPVLERRGSRGRAFRHFGVEMGDALQNFAAFEALQDHFRGQGASLAWRDWPTPFRDPGSAVVSAFAQEHAERVEFSVYLQSEADRQLASAALAMLETGRGRGRSRRSRGLVRPIAPRHRRHGRRPAGCR